MNERIKKTPEIKDRPLDGCTWEFSERGASRLLKGFSNLPFQEEKANWQEYDSFLAAGKELNLLSGRLVELFKEGWSRKAILKKEEEGGTSFAIVLVNPHERSTFSTRTNYEKLKRHGILAPIFSREESVGDFNVIHHGRGEFELSHKKSNALLMDTGLYSFGELHVSYNKIQQDRNLFGKDRGDQSFQSGVVIITGFAMPVDKALAELEEKQLSEMERVASGYDRQLKGIEEEGIKTRGEIERQRLPRSKP